MTQPPSSGGRVPGGASPGARPSPEIDAEDRRRHLEIIQGVITRLANSGTDTKHWAVTLGGTAFGASALNGMWYLASIGVAVVLSFSILNMYYLFEERLFRQLYVAAARDEIPRFDMRKNLYRLQIPSRARTYFSWSVMGFFGALLVGGLVAMTIGLMQSEREGGAQQHRPHHPHRQHEAPSPMLPGEGDASPSRSSDTNGR
jgi:hypothetical protein